MAAGRFLLVASLVLLALVPATSGGSRSETVARARIGMNYFDGWSDQLSGFHFNGLVRVGPNGQFPERRPLAGWRDNTPDAMRASLNWARQDGVDFFYFDWFYHAASSEDPYLNTALSNYLKLSDHRGVGAALMYVNIDQFTVPQSDWESTVTQWVTDDFTSPDYARVGGKPLLYIIDSVRFNEQWGGRAGVNAALETLRRVAIAHGLPGVFVVGSVFIGTCVDEVGWDYFASLLQGESWDALTQGAYPAAACERDGAQPYANLVTAGKLSWDYYAGRLGFRSIPSVQVGWDPRPWDEKANGHLWWFRRTPEQFGAFVNDAIEWAMVHPDQRVEPPPARPLVMVTSWNELGEGMSVVPTVADGYRYGQALARAIGIPWVAARRYRLSVAVRRGSIRSRPAGIDCPRHCRAIFDSGWQVTLTAIPRRRHVFRGWNGACRGRAQTCSFMIERNQSVRAVFGRR